MKIFSLRKELTPEQYTRTNKTMASILMFTYVICCAIQFFGIGTSMSPILTILTCVVYLLLGVTNFIVSKKVKDGRKVMISMAVNFLVVFIILAFCNGSNSFIMMFPVLIGFMIYMNGRVIALGVFSALVICMFRTFQFRFAGDLAAYETGNLTVMALIVAIYGAFRSITLLIKFGQEDQAVIEQEAERRKEVAETVSGIVENLDTQFRGVLNELNDINSSMESAHMAIDDIANSSESTADAVTQQAGMTGEIQHRLEGTNETATVAKGTARSLKEVVANGKILADELQEQSVLVDRNTEKISETVETLVSNVQQVYSITDSIINISSQTNLLALNASIEAARAGEAGKGFAVVADEIRKLAEETKASTEKITEIINELMKVTGDTKIGIEESAASINVQRQKVQEVNASFAEVERGMIELENGMDSMSREVGEVLEANKGIVDSISMLSAASQQVSAGVQVSKGTLDTTVDTLHRFVDTVDGTFEQLQKLKETSNA